MNLFFVGDAGRELPASVYARAIERDETYVLFDAVEAGEFDKLSRDWGSELTWERYRAELEHIRIFAIEVNSRNGAERRQQDWLNANPSSAEYVLIEIEKDPEGVANLYTDIGTSQRVHITAHKLGNRRQSALRTATDLSSHIAEENEIETKLPSQAIDHVVVLDVGQGAAAALIDTRDNVVAYVDVGSGVLADIGTWPAAMTGLCLNTTPVVLLTHWHYDHFHAANRYPKAQSLTWIAPLQTLGPGPQSAMASSIVSAGKLLIWRGSRTLSTGSIELERCNGPTGDQNRTGLAVWVKGPNGEAPILLPGDCGYTDITSLSGRSITSFAVSHHGGRAPGTPPADPGHVHSKAALSYGHSNSYHHPLAASLARLSTAGWGLGTSSAPLDERHTETRPGGIGAKGLGHIDLYWLSSARTSRACSCGCSIIPTQ